MRGKFYKERLLVQTTENENISNTRKKKKNSEK